MRDWGQGEVGANLICSPFQIPKGGGNVFILKKECLILFCCCLLPMIGGTVPNGAFNEGFLEIPSLQEIKPNKSL